LDEVVVYPVFDLLNGARITRSYVEHALKGGLTAIHVTVNNFSQIAPYPTLRQSLRELASLRAHYASLADVTLIVKRFEDFERARSQGKLGIVLGYQNVPGVDRDLGMLELFSSLGVRVVQIAHNNRGLYADGCAEPANAGLSALGRELIAELNRLRILIDLSHTGEQSTIEAIQLSQHPVGITHANAYAVCANVRNKSDAVLKALKEKQGVIGLCYLTPLVRGGGVKPDQSDMLAHLVHIRSLIGSEHIGIGSDFIDDQPPERYQEFMRKPEVYGTWPWRFPIEDLADQQQFLSSLSSAGLTDEEIRGIAGGNFMRLFQKVIQ
jgi:membrane dipeptidase